MYANPDLSRSDNLAGSSYYDCSAGPTPSNRRAVYNLIPKDPTGTISKYRLYVDSSDSWHTIFKLNRRECASDGGPVSDAQCDMIIDTVKLASFAFLDWHLRGDPAAETFLLNKKINVPNSNGIFKWSYK